MKLEIAIVGGTNGWICKNIPMDEESKSWFVLLETMDQSEERFAFGRITVDIIKAIVSISNLVYALCNIWGVGEYILICDGNNRIFSESMF